MSDKVKSKDLSYDTTLPPFLQRLHAQNAGRDTDRHERPIPRPKGVKDTNEDDGPTVVDESGETISKEEYEQLTKASADDSHPLDGGDVGGSVTGTLENADEAKVSGALLDKDDAVERRQGEQRVTDGLATKKRKAVKIIGDEDSTEVEVGEEEEKETSTVKKVAKKTKKKTKPIKLAFDNEEG